MGLGGGDVGEHGSDNDPGYGGGGDSGGFGGGDQNEDRGGTLSPGGDPTVDREQNESDVAGDYGPGSESQGIGVFGELMDSVRDRFGAIRDDPIGFLGSVLGGVFGFNTLGMPGAYAGSKLGSKLGGWLGETFSDMPSTKEALQDGLNSLLENHQDEMDDDTKDAINDAISQLGGEGGDTFFNEFQSSFGVGYDDALQNVRETAKDPGYDGMIQDYRKMLYNQHSPWEEMPEYLSRIDQAQNDYLSGRDDILNDWDQFERDIMGRSDSLFGSLADNGERIMGESQGVMDQYNRDIGSLPQLDLKLPDYMGGSNIPMAPKAHANMFSDIANTRQGILNNQSDLALNAVNSGTNLLESFGGLTQNAISNKQNLNQNTYSVNRDSADASKLPMDMAWQMILSKMGQQTQPKSDSSSSDAWLPALGYAIGSFFNG